MGIELDYDRQKFKKIGVKRFEKYSSGKGVSLFIKLGETKLIQIVDKVETDPIDTIDKYVAKGVKHLFLHLVDYEEFIAAAGNKILDVLTDKNTSTEKLVNSQVDSVNHVHESIKNVGLNETTVGFIGDLAESTLKNIKSDSPISNIIKKVMDKNDYISQLATMTSYMAMATANEMEIKDAETAKKLGIAALLQDATLDDEELAKIQSVDSEEYKALPEDKKILVLSHPAKSSKLLEDAGEYPAELLTLLSQHHEKPEGKGFPNKLGHLKISPLCCIFILAHDYSHMLLTKGNSQETLKEILTIFPDIYSKGNFRKPLEAFFSALKKK